MPAPDQRSQAWRWLLWLTVLALWTVALVLPDPLRRVGSQLDSITLKYLIAKLSHFSVYAGLAASLAFLGRRPPFWLLGLLVLHTALGEWLQGFVPSRSGSVTDVLIDLAGIGLGVALTWRRWRGKNPDPHTINAPPNESNQ